MRKGSGELAKILEPTFRDIKKRVDLAEQVKKEGGNIFLQLEARLRDTKTGKLGEDIVIYAIRTLKDSTTAKEFVESYLSDIRQNPKKYPVSSRKNPKEYVVHDVAYALGYFCSFDTISLWDNVLSDFQKTTITKL